MKKITSIIILLLAINFGYGQILTFDFAGATGAPESYDSNYNDPNLGVSTITRGDGLINVNNNDSFNAQGWASTSIANAVTGGDYMEFTIVPNSGYEFSITSIDINFQRSSTGVSAIALRSSIDGYASNIDSEKTVVDNTNLQNFTFTFSHTSSTPVTYRFYAYAEDSGGSGRFEGGGDDIEINGTVTALPACGATTTWNGSWDNGTPDNSIEAIINGPYNTSTNGNLIACTLTVSNNATLTVADNTHLTIQGNITVGSGSSIVVQPYGAVVQNDDSALVTNSGTIQVTKETALLNAWYEYTYWSSPVSGETIGVGLSASEASRRFVFNAQNYLDATAETGNNNATDPGQDGIDDNGDDWQAVSGVTVMTPGVGYAATHSEALFIGPPMSSPPYQFGYVFTGAFNNGVITVPIYRNDSELLDDNPNLIGNPYPSAISADLFLSANPGIDNVINLWSQNTVPSSTVNGNEDQNFSTSDYAKINGASQTAGGDGVMPNRFIPSGQAFFVSMDNAAAPVTPVSGMIYTTDVTFNNSMRVSGATDNSQFFKNSNKTKKSSQIDNKLWVNLTSDNGLFHQISVAYVNGATNQDDGAYYDAERVITPNTFSGLYSTIDDKKFAIQGREPGSLDENEVIKLGFKTSIEIATLYKLSIADIQGDFLTNNTVYLKDNLLNKTHNLSESDYTFTSEVGEFNNRFEIVFNNIALSTTEQLVGSNSLKIVDLVGNDEVQFSVTENLEIQSITIYDLLGRNLKSFKGSSSKEIVNLSTLSSAVFIAKVTLSNGVTITKRAIKR